MLLINDDQISLASDINIYGSSLFSFMESAAKSYDIFVIDDNFIAENLPKRQPNVNKYNCGFLGLVCGSYGMSGAAYIAAKAAYRCGCGLVKLALPEKIYPIIASLLPEAVFLPLKDCDYVSSRYTKDILESFSKTDCLLLGCGISCNNETTSAAKEIIENYKKPIIIDADGINAIAKSIEILEQTDGVKILTPHYGEMSRLCGLSPKDIEQNFISIAGSFASKYGVYLVLKGQFTAVATPEGKIYLNFLKGNSGMAVGGSGDMLSGMIGAFLAEGISPEKACALAVYLHAAAGDIAAERLSKRSINPTDMIEALPCLFKKFE